MTYERRTTAQMILNEPERQPNKTAAAVAIVALMTMTGVGHAATHRYDVSVDSTLQVLTVEAHLDGTVSSIRTRSSRAARYLRQAQRCRDGRALEIRGRRMTVPRDGIDCFRYQVDLAGVAGEYRSNQSLSSDVIVASPSFWLWRPPVVAGVEVRVEFHLPDGLQVAAPWQPVLGSLNKFVIEPSPGNGRSAVVFGDFDYREVAVPGAVLRTSILPGRSSHSALPPAAIAEWVAATATDISLVYQRFPNPSPMVLVVPAGRPSFRQSAVPFGQVVRDGGAMVELFIDSSQPIDSFLGDWTATHEFSHLLLPYLNRDHKWISEGFAQFYQNVLLTRAGNYEPQFAWQKLHDGLNRGRTARPDLSPNEAASRSASGARMKVYWSGAALALLADVELRQRSGGRESLDVVLDRFQTCCLPSESIWDGPEFLAKLDSLVDEPVFMPLYRRIADQPGFPDVLPTLSSLGVLVENGRVSLTDDASLSAIRHAMMEVDPDVARSRAAIAERWSER